MGDRRIFRATVERPGTGWYRIVNKADTANSADVYIYDEIGYWGITAGDFVKELAALNVSTIELKINSPGGEVFDGIAIYNALKTHSATVNVSVDGIAASAASFIAMAGDKITMGRGAEMMIHDALGICVGNAAEMRTTADLLDRTSETIASFYAERAGGSVTSWRDAMRAETWYNGDEAVKAGLADAAITAPAADAGGKAAATNSWDLSPFRYPGRAQAPAPTLADRTVVVDPVDELEAQLFDVDLSGFDPDQFVSAVTAGATPDPQPQLSFDPDVFRAAITLAANTMPAVPAPVVPDPVAPDPVTLIDPKMFERALREAKL